MNNIDQATAEYFVAIDNPNGEIWQSTGVGFRRQRELKYATAMAIGLRFDVDPRLLISAEQNRRQQIYRDANQLLKENT